MLLGCIADDFTGATDLAQHAAARRHAHDPGDRRARRRHRRAAGRGRGGGGAEVAHQRARRGGGAIARGARVAARRGCRAGPVQVLLHLRFHGCGQHRPGGRCPAGRAGRGFTVACPAFPENRRTIYQGHLFVGEQLLSDSPMKDHPLTPMRDANLVRVLGRQTTAQGRPGRAADGAAGRRRDARGVRTPQALGHAMRSSMRWRTRTCSRWARPARNCRCSPAARASPWDCRRTCVGLLKRRPRRHAAAGGHAAVIAGQLLGADQAQVAALDEVAPGVAASIRCGSRGGAAPPSIARGLGRDAARCGSGAGVLDRGPDAVRDGPGRPGHASARRTGRAALAAHRQA